MVIRMSGHCVIGAHCSSPGSMRQATRDAIIPVTLFVAPGLLLSGAAGFLLESNALAANECFLGVDGESTNRRQREPDALLRFRGLIQLLHEPPPENHQYCRGAS